MKLRPLLPSLRCVLHQRESKYDRLSSCLVDFKSRAVCASVKNFQIVQSEPEDPKQRPKFYAADGEGGALFDAHVGRVRAGKDARFKRPTVGDEAEAPPSPLPRRQGRALQGARVRAAARPEPRG